MVCAQKKQVFCLHLQTQKTKTKIEAFLVFWAKTKHTLKKKTNTNNKALREMFRSPQPVHSLQQIVCFFCLWILCVSFLFFEVFFFCVGPRTGLLFLAFITVSRTPQKAHHSQHWLLKIEQEGLRTGFLSHSHLAVPSTENIPYRSSEAAARRCMQGLAQQLAQPLSHNQTW